MSFWKSGATASTTPPSFLPPLRLGELDQQDCVRCAAHEALDGGFQQGDLAAKFDHRAIDQLDRRRAELDQVLCCVHGRVEGREVADTQHRLARARRQLQADGLRIGKRPLRADQEMGQVVGLPTRDQCIDVVTADAAQKVGKAGADFLGLRRAEVQEVAEQVGQGHRQVIAAEMPVHLTEVGLAAVGEDGVDGDDVVAHGAVADGARPARVVRRHAPDGRP
jgi:hypothetical protein